MSRANTTTSLSWSTELRRPMWSRKAPPPDPVRRWGLGHPGWSGPPLDASDSSTTRPEVFAYRATRIVSAPDLGRRARSDRLADGDRQRLGRRGAHPVRRGDGDRVGAGGRRAGTGWRRAVAVVGEAEAVRQVALDRQRRPPRVGDRVVVVVTVKLPGWPAGNAVDGSEVIWSGATSTMNSCDTTWEW